MKAFDEAKARIRSFAFRYVEELNPLFQVLLECDVAIALNTPYNSFETNSRRNDLE